MIKKNNNHKNNSIADNTTDKETLSDNEQKVESKIKESEVDKNQFSVEQLKEIAREKERLAETYYDQLIRLKAEFENYRKRVERERETQRAWAKEEILIKQISLLDVMEQALNAAKNTQDISSIVKGLEMIIKEFEKMLADEGVNVVETDGIFDISKHEVVETVEDNTAQDGTVKDVISKGYAINGRVIRPARVKIVKNPHPTTVANKDEKSDEDLTTSTQT